MSTPNRRPLYRRDVAAEPEPTAAGTRRLPIEAAVLDEHQAVVDVHQADAQPPRRRPLADGPNTAAS